MRACTIRSLPWLVAVLAALLPGSEGAAQPFGVIEGRVEVLRRGLFGAPSPIGDNGGVVVYVTGFTRAAPPELARLDQRNEQFRPRLLPIVAGQTVEFPNRDRIYHNVFSVSPVHTFDLGQYRSSDPPKRERFERPGLVPVYCNIHPRMIAYVAVLENDAFATSGADGRFRIERVPPGRHSVSAFLPGAERVSQEVEVPAGGVVEISLSVVAGRIPPHRRKDGSSYPRPGSELER